ncbi:MAG: helix-turn-helix domain-containing protein [Bacteroidaceae bacterium]|nr:helix-turn-helix domain-containing protein [Bacteroidaceae bacterium]
MDTNTSAPKHHNPELRTAWDFVEHTGHSVFLTGKAGTGKTTFLRTVVEHTSKRCIVVAPTGVAAINAGGVTVHSFFQLPLSPYIPGAQMKSKFDFSKEKRRLIASLDLLIIDEISMVRSDLLDAIDSVLRRFRDHGKPFGGVQLLMIGDLAQLTPVVTPTEEPLLKAYYDTPYFFGSKALAAVDYVTIALTHVYRQQDEKFISILNHVREARLTPDDFAALAARHIPAFSPSADEGYIRLTTHNNLAARYNDAELQRLPGVGVRFSAKVRGTFPETSYPTDETLLLKEGAQVMFIKNDPSGEHRYYNGRIGRVVSLSEDEILVQCTGDDEPIAVEPLEWENTRYRLNDETREIEADVQGVFQQYPLRLAWAVTIHKSQGLTFERAVIDVNQSFAPGQVYVALSRCRTLEGLVLTAPLDPRAILSDSSVNEYMAGQGERAKENIARLPLLKQEYTRHLLLELFDFSALFEAQQRMVRLFTEFFARKESLLYTKHQDAWELLKTQVEDVALKWASVIRSKPVALLNEPDFIARVSQSARYFADKLAKILYEPLLQTKKVKTENKQARKRLDSAWDELHRLWSSRGRLLEKISEKGFSPATYLKEKQTAILDVLYEGAPQSKKAYKPKVNKEPKPKTWEISYSLYRQGKSPKEIAEERGLKERTICEHLCRYVETGEIPVAELVPEIHARFLRAALEHTDLQGSLSAVKEMCPASITWNELHLVAAAMRGEQARDEQKNNDR